MLTNNVIYWFKNKLKKALKKVKLGLKQDTKSVNCHSDPILECSFHG